MARKEREDTGSPVLQELPGPLELPEEVPFDFASLPSVSLVETRQKKRFLIGGNLAPVITALPDGQVMRMRKGKIELDAQALILEEERVQSWLVQSIEQGDERVLEIFLANSWGKSEKAQRLQETLKEAFAAKDPRILNRLANFEVYLPTQGIAERNLIREGIAPELRKHPFVFRDANGNELPGSDVDTMLVREGRNSFKMLVGSRKGIEGIGIAQELGADKFRPDFAKVEKDPATDTIKIPLTKALDGSTPSAPIIEVRKGPIDIKAILMQEEQERAMQASAPPPRQRPVPTPSPSSSSRSSESYRSYGYSSGSN